jgi:glyoxylate reductase
MRKIFITRQLMPIGEQLLKPHFHVDVNPNDRPMTAEELKKIVKEYDGIVSTTSDKLNRETLSGAKIKVISQCAAGLDNVDLAFAKEKNIAVYNLPDAPVESTADLTLAILLSLIRKIPDAQRYVREGRWTGWDPASLFGEELNGKTFGIIGYGKIGKAVATRALGFGLRVLIYSRSKKDDPRVTQVPLDELYAKSDYISIHAPLTPETNGMIDKAAMSKMKKRALIINVGRGKIVRTDDLVEALMEGVVRGAALDVTDPEPLSASHPLCHMENCIVIPHIGSATVECRTQMAKLAAENLMRHFNDQP